MEKYRNPFSIRPEAGTVVDIGIARARRREKQERDARELETFASVSDLHDYLEERGHVDACAHVFKCDPWKYEPILLDDLIDERIGSNDPKKIDRLRKLIRAGSWSGYQRSTRGEIIEDLDAVDERITLEGIRRIHDAERQSDAKSASELSDELAEARRVLNAVNAAIREGLRGDAAEDATRTIEDLQASSWIKLKGVLAAHGLSLEEARADQRASRYAEPFLKEIEQLRRLRDYLYNRRCYPNWAKINV